MAQKYHSNVATEISAALALLRQHGLTETMHDAVIGEVTLSLSAHNHGEDALAVAALAICPKHSEQGVAAITAKIAMV